MFDIFSRLDTLLTYLLTRVWRTDRPTASTALTRSVAWQKPETQVLAACHIEASRPPGIPTKWVLGKNYWPRFEKFVNTFLNRMITKWAMKYWLCNQKKERRPDQKIIRAEKVEPYKAQEKQQQCVSLEKPYTDDDGCVAIFRKIFVAVTIHRSRRARSSCFTSHSK